MAEIMGSIVGHLKSKITALDESLNFQAPENIVVYTVKQDKIPADDVELTNGNHSWYLGKMFYNKETIYSDDFIIGSIGFLLGRLKDGDKVTIQLAPIVSRLINGEEDVKGAMSFEDQKDHILGLARKNHKAGVDKIEVINIESRHPELVDLLANFGIKGLKTEQNPLLDPVNFSSLDIARYLYRLMDISPEFYERISNTKPAKLKKSSKKEGDSEREEIKSTRSNSDYYGMIEISMRLYDFLKGITIQGGEKRQNMYDQIIRDILYYEITPPSTEKKSGPKRKSDPKNLEQLIDLQSFCRQASGENIFSTVHFDSNEYKNLVKKQKRKDKMKNIISYGALAIALILGSVGGTIKYNKRQNELETQTNINQAIEELLDGVKISTNIRGNIHVDNPENYVKIGYLRTIAKKIGEIFRARYEVGDLSDDELTFLVLKGVISANYVEKIGEAFIIQSTTTNPKTGGIVFERVSIDYKKVNEFIDRIFIEGRTLDLVERGVKINKYGKYSQYRENFYNTIKLFGSNANIGDNQIKILGDYTTKEGEKFNIAIKNGRIVAYFIDGKNDNNKEYGDMEGLAVASDFFQNIYVEDLIYRIRSVLRVSFYQNALNVGKPNRIISDTVLGSLFREGYFESTDSQYKYYRDWTEDDIMVFILNKFLPTITDMIKGSDFENNVKIQPIPYYFMKENIEAVKTTANINLSKIYNEIFSNNKNGRISSQSKKHIEMGQSNQLFSQQELSEYLQIQTLNVKESIYLGIYTSSAGEYFTIWTVRLKGEKYIIAQKGRNKQLQGLPSVGNLIYGMEIAKEYLKRFENVDNK